MRKELWQIMVLLFFFALTSSCRKRDLSSVVPLPKSSIIMSQTVQEAGDNRYQQGLEVFNGRILSFVDNSDAGHLGFIYSLTTGSFLGVIDVVDIEDCHSNSAQFTDVFYDERDTYPLLLLSQCQGRGSLNQNKLFVIRLQESGNDLFGTIVKTITPSDEITGAWFGADYVYDSITRELIVVTNTFYYGDVEDESNKTNVFVFDCPVLTDSTPVRLERAKKHFYLPYHVLQAATIWNGVLVLAAQKVRIVNGSYISLVWPQNILEFINLDSGSILLYIPLYQHMEPEGCCAYNNAVYVAYHNVKAIGNSAAFRVERYTLNGL